MTVSFSQVSQSRHVPCQVKGNERGEEQAREERTGRESDVECDSFPVFVIVSYDAARDSQKETIQHTIREKLHRHVLGSWSMRECGAAKKRVRGRIPLIASLSATNEFEPAEEGPVE